MDKFFLFIGVHRFWRFNAIKFFSILLFAVVCAVHIYVLSLRDSEHHVHLAQSLLCFYAYMSVFFVLTIVFSLAMRRVLKPSTLAAFDAELIEALKKESNTRIVPISWRMVARVTEQIRWLNKDIEKKSKQAREMKAQAEWIAARYD